MRNLAKPVSRRFALFSAVAASVIFAADQSADAAGFWLRVQAAASSTPTLMPNATWAASAGSADGAAFAGGSGIAPPAVDPNPKDPGSSYYQQAGAGASVANLHIFENPVNYITITAGITSRRWIKQVVGWCEGNTVTVTSLSINPDDNTFGWVFPVAAHPSRCGTATFAFYIQPYEGYERRLVFNFELNGNTGAPGYVNSQDTAHSVFVDPVAGSDANAGTAASPFASVTRGTQQCPNFGTVFVVGSTSTDESISTSFGPGTGNTNYVAVNHSRRITVRPLSPSTSFSMTRANRTTTRAYQSTIAVTGTNFQVTGNLAFLTGFNAGQSIYLPTTGEYLPILTFNTGTGAGTLSVAPAVNVSGVPYEADLNASLAQNKHCFGSNNIRFINAITDTCKLPWPCASNGYATQTGSLGLGAPSGTYAMGSRIEWINSTLQDPNGVDGPRIFGDNTAYPTPTSYNPTGSGYWFSGGQSIGDESNGNIADGASSGALGTTIDPYGLSSSQHSFYKCNTHFMRSAGLAVGCVNTTARDIGFFANSNLCWLNNQFIMTDYPLLRAHRPHFLTMFSQPSYNSGTNTSTITIAGPAPQFKPFASGLNYVQVELLSTTYPGAQRLSRWNVGAPGGTVQNGFQWLGYTAVGTNTSTVTCGGDLSACSALDTFIVWSADHTDIAQFNSVGASAPGQNNYIIQHNRFTTIDAQWALQQNGQQGVAFFKTLTATGTFTTGGTTNQATFSAGTASLNVGDIIIASATYSTTLQNAYTGTPLGQLKVAGTVGPLCDVKIGTTGTTNTYIVSATPDGSGNTDIVISNNVTNAAAGAPVVIGSAVAAGSQATQRPWFAITMIVDGTTVQTSCIMPPYTAGGFTREIGISSTGTAINFSSSVSGLVALNDYAIIYKTSLQARSYGRIMTLAGNGLSGTISKSYATVIGGAAANVAWTRWEHSKGTEGIFWIGNDIDAQTFQNTIYASVPGIAEFGQIQNCASNWGYIQNTINPVAPTTGNIANVFNPRIDNFIAGFDDFAFFDNILPGIDSGSSVMPVVNLGSVPIAPYTGINSDNNHWVTNGTGLKTSSTTGIPPIEAGASTGAVTFDSAGMGGTFRPKTGGGLSKVPLGNSTTGKLLMPAHMNWDTGVMELLPNAASTYLVGAHPKAVP